MFQNARTRSLLILSMLSLVASHANTGDDTLGSWKTPADLESIPADYPRIDGGTRGTNNPDDAAKQYSDSGWINAYIWATDLYDTKALSSMPVLAAKIKEVENFLCGNTTKKSVLIVNDSIDLIRLISAYIAVSADKAEAAGGTVKACHKRADYELIGQRLSGASFVGTMEAAWKKVTAVSTGSLLWHLPEVSEIINRGTHMGRTEAGAETEFARVMNSGQLKMLAGSSQSYYGTMMNEPKPGIRNFFKSFGSVVLIDELEKPELYVLMKSYARTLGFPGTLEDPALDYLYEKSLRHLMNLGSPLDAMYAVLSKIQSYRNDTNFNANEAFSVPVVKRAIGQVGNFPAWVLNESEKRRKMLSLESEIAAKLVGQKEALRATVRSVQIGFVAQRAKPKPISSVLFVGPTGTGKTYLAEQLSKKLFGRIAQTVDMTQYSMPHSSDAFSDLIANMLKSNPYQVIVFEEIDKAHTSVLDKLYFLLDEGRMLTSAQRSISAQGVIAIAITNTAERQISDFGPFRNATDGDKAAVAALKMSVNEALMKTYRTSFLNRFESTPVFYPFSRAEYQQLAGILVAEKGEAYVTRKWRINATQAVLDYIATNGASPLLGARPMERLVSLVVEGGLTDYELASNTELDNGTARNFVIDVAPGEKDAFVIGETNTPANKVKYNVDLSNVNFGF